MDKLIPHKKMPEKILLGAIFSLLSFFCLALMGALAKIASYYTHSSVLVFFQNAISFLFILPIALKYRSSLKTTRIGMHLFRAIMGTGAWYGLFLAVSQIPLTTAVLLTYSAPLWMAFFAWFLFKEKVTLRIWLGIIVGFFGILLVLRPGEGNFSLAMFFALASAILLAFALFAVKWLGETESLLAILFYYFLLSSILIAPLAILHWQTPPPIAWIYVIGIGIALVISQAFIILAYRFASPVSLGPYIYSVIVFSAGFDWLIWQQKFSFIEWIGIVLVIFGGILSAFKTKKLPT